MKTGFIGLGNMGASIARDLATSSQDVMVYDLRDEALAEFRALGARVAGSPADVARHAEVVGLCVRTDQQLLDVLEGEEGLLSSARPGLVVTIHSTIQLDTLEAARKSASQADVRIVDAPVSRGTNAPKTRAINFILGGDPEDVARARAFVDPAALTVIEAGPSGSALGLKICNNIITFLTTTTMRDVIRLANASGVDLEKLAELVSSNGAGSPNMLYSLRRSAGARIETAHTVDTAAVNAELGEKDLECALESAAALGVKLPAVEFGRGEIRDVMFELLA